MVTLAERAIGWYEGNARDLPWRRPGTSAWGVLVSEVMLQQTPVARVEPVWGQWMKRWPRPSDLATATPGDAIRAWGRLGYPRRALRLHRTAVAITCSFSGRVPAEIVDLAGLPGVGPYTARAVAVFAYGQRHPVVDTNVRRLVARAVSGLAQGGVSTTAGDLARVTALLPAAPAAAARASVALMELGALVCSARLPRCRECPLRPVCAWHATGGEAGDGSSTGVRVDGVRRAGGGAVKPAPGYVGTDRYVRGLMLAVLRDASTGVSRVRLDQTWPDAAQRERTLESLLADGLVVRRKGRYALP
jgi:A/G-specific adenine glycosylase